MFLFCTDVRFPSRIACNRIILTVRMKTILLKSLIQISTVAVSACSYFPPIFPGNCLEVREFLVLVQRSSERADLRSVESGAQKDRFHPYCQITCYG